MHLSNVNFNFQGSTFQEHLSQVDFYGYTALHAACEAGHADLIVPLLGNSDGGGGDDNDDNVKVGMLTSLCLS